jgi:hypothetical protein
MKTRTNNISSAFALFAFACFALSPQARAVDPPPDGGYPNQNTAEGEDALFNLTTGYNNTAVGFHALFSDVAGHSNTAVGWVALQRNTGGLANTAIGADALKNNTTGDANIAVGVDALLNNSTGLRNTAIGTESLKRNNGSDNIAIGYEAGMNIGTGSNTICIGHPGVTGDTNTIRIGTNAVQTKTIVAGINGATVPDGVGVVVGSQGQLGTIVSSAAFKDDIKPMDKASEAILALKPVTFRYKQKFDPDGIPQFGLVAEEVEKVNPDLVARDEQGKPYTVRYDAVNAMLLNEFLKEHRTVQEQQKEIDALKAELEEQRSLIQKVSAQLEKSSRLPQTFASNH